jgi:hypothetical protein
MGCPEANALLTRLNEDLIFRSRYDCPNVVIKAFLLSSIFWKGMYKEKNVEMKDNKREMATVLI